MGTPVATLQLTFDDEFTTFNNSPNGTTGWETRLPYYGAASRNLSGAGEAEYYSDSSVGTNPFTDTDGVLSINATTVAQTGKNALNEPYNSGAITTYDSFAQEYGYFEINAKLPTGNGFWSAFWLSPTSLDGQSELDGFEVLGNNTTQLYATTHSEVNGTFTPNLQEVSVPNASTAFHTYGVDWEPTTITWYEDGVAIATAPTPANMDEKMFLLLNLAVGAPGSWPGAPTSSSEFPGSYQVDYVHAYATAATKYVSGTAAIGIGAPEGEGSITGVVAVGLGIGTPIKGVTVSLLSTGGTVLQTTTSDGFGDYQFTYVAAGSYLIRITPPSGYVPLPGTTGTVSTTLAAGQADLIATLKLATSTGSVTGSVLLASGAGTAANAGVTVLLTNSAGTSTVATATTNAAGVFTFTNVVGGNYQVKYVAPTGEVLLSGPGNTGTGLTGAITVAAGQIALGTETLSLSGWTPAPATITGMALFGTAAQVGMTVLLLDSTGTTTLATTTTDSTGAFSFTGLAGGTYGVQYVAPSGEILQSGPTSTSTGLTSVLTVTAGETLALAAETLAPAPATITGMALLGTIGQAGITALLLDSTGATTLATTTTDSTGAFSFTGLAAGTYGVEYIAPSGEILQSGPASTSTGLTGALTVTAGQTLALAAETFARAPATITGTVLLGTAGQAGIAVLLLDSAGTTTLSTTTTDSTGAFSFTGLAAGTYGVEYVAPSGEILQSGPASTSSGLTGALTVTAGQTLALAAETLAPLGTIVGSVKLGSAAQAGVTVLLLDSTGTTTLATTTTTTSGHYSFNGLAVGYYRVQYVPPANEVIQSGPANPTTGETVVVGVTAGATRTMGPVTLAAGYATLIGSVLFAGAGQPGVTVTLLDNTGTAVATTASDSNGAFSFSQLAAGSYALDYTAPAGETFQAGDPADTTTGVTAPLTLIAGQTTFAPTEDLVLAPVSLTMNGSNATLIEGDGVFIVTGNPANGTLTLGNGNQSVTLSGYNDTVTLGDGNDTVFMTGPLQTLSVGDGVQGLALIGYFETVTLGDTPTGQTSFVAVNGSGETVVGGDGNISVTGPMGGSTVTLGNGDDTVTLTGSHNTVTVGTGTSVIDAGTNSEIIHAAGGNVTATVAGQSNLVDIGPGGGVINAGTARLDTFMTNATNQGLLIINGFSATAGNVLDLTRTLAGTGVASDLSNIGNYVTASVSGGNTTLLVDPTGGNSPYAFAQLQGTATTIANLLAARAFSVS